jgi:hypothetical protein
VGNKKNASMRKRKLVDLAAREQQFAEYAKPDVALIRRVDTSGVWARLKGLYEELEVILPDGRARLRPISELRLTVLNAPAINTISRTYAISKDEVVASVKDKLVATAEREYKAKIVSCVGSKLVDSVVVYPEIGLRLKGPQRMDEVARIDDLLRGTYPKVDVGEYGDFGVPLVPAVEGVVYTKEVYDRAAWAISTTFPKSEGLFLNLMPIEQI